MNNTNTARAPYIKHNSPEVKDVVNFAYRFWYVLELKIKNLKIAMQGKIQDTILNNVTTDSPVYKDYR